MRWLPGVAARRARRAVDLEPERTGALPRAGEIAVKSQPEELAPYALAVVERLVPVLSAPLGSMPRSIIENRRAPRAQRPAPHAPRAGGLCALARPLRTLPAWCVLCCAPGVGRVPLVWRTVAPPGAALRRGRPCSARARQRRTRRSGPARGPRLSHTHGCPALAEAARRICGR